MAQIEKTVRASVRMNNNDDTMRKYDISAEVAIENGEEQSVARISAGTVKSEGNAIATFYDEFGSRSVSYIGLTLDEQNEVNVAIDAFINEVKAMGAEPATINM